MKKILLALLVICLLIPTSAAFANSGAPGTWGSSINIQNPSASAANVTLTFFDAAGNPVHTFPVTPAIAAYGSRSLYVPADIAGLTSGQFSVVASSDADVNIVVNSSSTGPSTAGAYSGLKAEDLGMNLYFPGLYNNYYGFYSELVVQNTASAAAAVQVQFYNQKTGAAVGAPFTANIPSGASSVFTLSKLSPALPSGNANGLYSAKVTSASLIGGIANTWSSYIAGEYSTYTGATQGALTSVVPALYKHYYGFVSSLTVQNITASAANVTVTYSNGKTETATISPNQAVEFFQPNNADLPQGNSAGVFSAVVQSDQNVIAIVNVEDKVLGSLASYNGVANPTSTVLCPVTLQSFYKWFSAETVQNVSTTNSANITVTYASGQTRTFNNVPPMGTVNVIELVNAGSVLPNSSSVAATITSTQPIVAVVQENSNIRYAEAAGDYLLAYTCTNK